VTLQKRELKNFRLCQWGDERTVKRTQTMIEDPHWHKRKSLEANTFVPAVKSVKVEYASRFSIKPLIDFFNRAFRCVVDYSGHDQSDAFLIQYQTSREEIPTLDCHSSSSSSNISFISCCNRFDSSGSVSSYYSLEEISSELGDEVFDLRVEDQLIDDGQCGNGNSRIEEISFESFETSSKLEDEDFKTSDCQQHHKDNKVKGFMDNNSDKSDCTANKLNNQKVISDKKFLFEPEETLNNSIKQADINNAKNKHETKNFKSDIKNENINQSKNDPK
jgi:hypothetical protein